MIFFKRLFDIVIALTLIVILGPIILLVSLTILIIDGSPVFFISERMKSVDRSFQLIKFRTMRPSKEDSGVTGGDKANRLTKTGAFFRRTRIDELPQLWNVLRGDMSFVGPRPPLRQYVESFPDLYAKVLLSKPGITGLASILYHRHEENLLARCSSVEETNEVYSRVCIPRKAQLDLIYQKNWSLCFDIRLMIKTMLR